MLATASMRHRAPDNEYVEEMEELLEGMTTEEMGDAIMWLSRMVRASLIDKHDGDLEEAAAELRETAVCVALAASEMETVADDLV